MRFVEVFQHNLNGITWFLLYNKTKQSHDSTKKIVLIEGPYQGAAALCKDESVSCYKVS